MSALIVTTDAVLRIARSPTARASLNRLRSITIAEGLTGRERIVARAGGFLRPGDKVRPVAERKGR